jgi:glycosyltransferase involved in cell wall biosynthesis
MKICLIAPIPPFRGGIAKYCYSLAKELEKRHNLLLLSYKRQYPELLYGKKKQIYHDVARAEVIKEFKNITYDIDSVNISSWFKISKTISAFNPDIVLLPWWVTYWTPMYLYLLCSLRKKGIRVVFICINVYEHEDNTFKNLLTKIILRTVDSFIVHSEQEKNELLKICPRAEVKKHLLPLFEYDVKTEVRRDTAMHLLFFGFVRPYKGLDTLLQALAILRNHDISLKIVGEFWNDKARYIELINNLKITERIEIIDQYVPDNEMSQYFSWADLVVLPYRKTITSGVIATAYGFKKPVLATNVGGFYEVIQDGFTGKIVTSDDPQTIADGILWFLANKQINFAENISTFASQNMSWSSLVDMIEEFQKQAED